jgi:hypothetical protein
MINSEPKVTGIMIGNNESMPSVSNDDYKGIFLQKDGTTLDFTVQDVIYIPNLMVNNLSCKGQIISLKFGKMKFYLTEFSNKDQGSSLGLK